MENSVACKEENEEYFSLELHHPSSSSLKIDEKGLEIDLPEKQLTQLCRLCAHVVDKVTNLFTYSENGQSLADKINSCLPVTVKKNDLLPKNVCSNCINKLMECFQFSETCITAERRLMSQNSTSSPNTNIKKNNSEGSDGNANNYRCPLCEEGTLQVIDSVIRNAAEEDTSSNTDNKEETNIESIGVSNNYNDVSKVSGDINENNQITHHNGNLVSNFFMTSTKQHDISNCNFVCRICSKLLSDFDMIHNHSKLHSRFNFYPCVLCENMYFINESQLENHFSYNHQLLKSNQLKENRQKSHLQSEIVLNNDDFSTSNTLSYVNFFTQLNEESQPVKFNICSEILEGESLLYNGYIIPETNRVCQVCESQFNTDAAYLLHMDSEHVANALQTPINNKCAEPIVVSKCVQKEQDAKKPIDCELCGDSFSQLIQLKKHKKQFHGDNCSSKEQICYQCSECKVVFPDMTQITKHSSIHEQININPLYARNVFKCEYCNSCYLNKEELKHHLSHHVGQLSYSCLHCDLQFESYHKLSEHKKTYHDGETTSNKFSIPVYYFCEYCGKSFEQLRCLYIHRYKSHLKGRTLPENDHSKKKSSATSSQENFQTYLCEICGKIFDSQTNLTKHRKQEHPQTSKYQCSDCGKVLANLTGLIIHRRLHTGEKPFSCDLCGKSFHQSSGMYTHRRTHTRECPYRCEYCGQAYNVKGDLDNHRRAKHTKERPFKCETCQKSFLTSSVFYQHRILHTGVRKYKCMYCEKTFARWNALRLHIRTHTGEKPYICYVCQRGFAQKGDMKKHMKTQHNILEVPDTA